eukprot:GFYU01000208.1.p1 GENE.GFYU01000208.1~~GFYU01000208.1.p1  ORF type:complete len:180 (-),score=39.66 GFYU01000208.1:86-625(-)
MMRNSLFKAGRVATNALKSQTRASLRPYSGTQATYHTMAKAASATVARYPSMQMSSVRRYSDDSHPDFASQNKPLADVPVQERIQELVTKDKIVLFMKGVPQAPQCGFSNQVCAALNQVGAEFSAYNVLADEELRQGVKEFSDWPTIPQLYVNGEFIGGCDIVVGMYRDGELKEALQLE